MPTDRERILELEKEVDDIKAEVIVQWGRIRRMGSEIAKMKEDESEERASQTQLERYRSELPSETHLSLRPTGLRVLLRNGRPSSFLVLILVLGIIALVWLLHPR